MLHAITSAIVCKSWRNTFVLLSAFSSSFIKTLTQIRFRQGHFSRTRSGFFFHKQNRSFFSHFRSMIMTLIRGGYITLRHSTDNFFISFHLIELSNTQQLKKFNLSRLEISLIEIIAQSLKKNVKFFLFQMKRNSHGIRGLSLSSRPFFLVTIQSIASGIRLTVEHGGRTKANLTDVICNKSCFL